MTIINSVRDPSAVSEARRSGMGFARQSGLRQEVEARIALVATELDEADLEELVADRTRELAEVNQRLADEVSERRKAETALWHTQKFDLIGQLTGGIAHDFNNLLTVISGNLELIHQAFENHPDPLSSTSQPRLLKLLVAAEGAADHAAKITQQLLAFAEPTRVDHLLKASEGFLQRAAGEAVSVTFVSAPVLWQCRIDPVQLEAAILNLVVNARDAMPEGGTLWIEVANVSVDEASREAERELSLATMCGSSSRVLGTAWRRR